MQEGCHYTLVWVSAYLGMGRNVSAICTRLTQGGCSEAGALTSIRVWSVTLRTRTSTHATSCRRPSKTASARQGRHWTGAGRRAGDRRHRFGSGYEDPGCIHMACVRPPLDETGMKQRQHPPGVVERPHTFPQVTWQCVTLYGSRDSYLLRTIVKPNAAAQARQTAGARYERTLFAVACSRLLGPAPAPDGLEKRFLTPLLPSERFISFPTPAIPATGDRAIPAPRCKAGSRSAHSWRSTCCSEVDLFRQKAPGLSRKSLP